MRPESPLTAAAAETRKGEPDNAHPNRPSQFFEAQLAGSAAEEINRTRQRGIIALELR